MEEVRVARPLGRLQSQAELSSPKKSAHDLLRNIVDRFVALMALLFLTPFLLVIGMLIKIDSPGPILFRQRRIGRDGVSFTIYKLRTMTLDCDMYARKGTYEENRGVTRFGNFLRNRGIDEIPQLINVLRGEMALIGPRPEMPFIVQEYAAGERARLSILPGITGYWQVAGPMMEPIHAHMEFDLYYLRHRSLRLDGWILVQTLKILFCMGTTRRGIIEPRVQPQWLSEE